MKGKLFTIKFRRKREGKTDYKRRRRLLLSGKPSYTIKGSKEFALIKGIVDSGLKVSYSEGIFPSEDRLKGAHIAKYAESVKGDKKKFERLFSDYVKKGVDPTNLTKIFDEVKLNIGKVK